MDYSKTQTAPDFSDYYNNNSVLYPTNATFPYDITRAAALATTLCRPTPLSNDLLSSPWGSYPSQWDIRCKNTAPATSSSFSAANTVTSHLVATSNLKTSQTPKRKRKTTPTQRVAANVRERRRMCSLNSSFDKLRKRVPAFAHEKRLSRIQTLRLAMYYIAFMTELLTGQDIFTLMKQQQTMRQQTIHSVEAAAAAAAAGKAGAAGAGMWQPYDTVVASTAGLALTEPAYMM